MIFNRNIYTINKNNVSNFMNLINTYHYNPEIKVTIDKNTVTLCVVSSANIDFYNLLPPYKNLKYLLTKQQNDIVTLINKTLHKRLKTNNINIPIIEKLNCNNFNELEKLSYNLRFTTRMFINRVNETIYLGIGSKKLGYYVMSLTYEHIKDASCPRFNINKGFIDPFYDVYADDSTNYKNRFAILNKQYFDLWKNKYERFRLSV